MRQFLLRFPKTSTNKLQIVDRLNNSPVYHVSVQNPKYFVPNISMRAADWEDNTIPKLYVGADVLSCIAGAGNIFTVTLHSKAGVKIDDPVQTRNNARGDYKGGFYIHSFRNLLTLKNKKDVENFSKQGLMPEEYIVAYKSDLITIKPTLSGKFFIKDYKMEFMEKRLARRIFNVYIEVLDMQGMEFSIPKKVHLDKGYYKMIFTDDYGAKAQSADTSFQYSFYPLPKDIVIEAVSKAEHDKAKMGTASMLSYKDTTKWKSW